MARERPHATPPGEEHHLQANGRGSADAVPAAPGEQERCLREFGLSEYASRAYLALLKLGTSEARPVSRLARVPIAKVYSTLDQLAEKGLCVVEPGPPKRFSPVPIGDFLDALAARHMSEAQAVEERKEELARLFPLAPTAHMDDRGAFQVLRGRRATLDKLRQLYEARPQSILLHTADNFLARAAAVPLMQAAQASGARVRILARLDATTLDPLARVAGFAEVRAKDRGLPNILVAVFDGKSALVTHFIPDDGSSTRGQDVSLFTTEEAIVGALSAFVEHEWERAERLEDAKARIALGDPPPVWRSVPAAEVDRAFEELASLAPGDIRVATPLAPAALEARALGAYRRALDAGHDVRVATDIADLAALEAAERLEALGVEVRHDSSAAVAGLSAALVGPWSVFSLRESPRAEPVGAIVTNDGRVHRALLALLDARWGACATPAARRAQLEREGPASDPERLLAFETLFAHLPDPVVLLDRELRVLLHNPAAAPDGGASCAPAWSEGALGALARAARDTGASQRGEVLDERTGAWLAVSIVPARGLLLAWARDVSSPKRREAQVATLASTLETMAGTLDAGYGWYDLGSQAGAWSEGMYRLLGMEPGAPLDPDGLAVRLHPEDRAAFLAAVASSAQGAQAEVDARILRADGQQRHCRQRLRALAPEGQPVLVIAARDRTAEVEREALLRAALEGEAGEWEYDSATRAYRWSPEALRLLGGSEPRAADLAILDLVLEHALRSGQGFVVPWTCDAEPEGLPLRLAGYPVAAAGQGASRVVGTLSRSPPRGGPR